MEDQKPPNDPEAQLRALLESPDDDIESSIGEQRWWRFGVAVILVLVVCAAGVWLVRSLHDSEPDPTPVETTMPVAAEGPFSPAISVDGMEPCPGVAADLDVDSVLCDPDDPARVITIDHRYDPLWSSTQIGDLTVTENGGAVAVRAVSYARTVVVVGEGVDRATAQAVVESLPAWRGRTQSDEPPLDGFPDDDLFAEVLQLPVTQLAITRVPDDLYITFGAPGDAIQVRPTATDLADHLLGLIAAEPVADADHLMIGGPLASGSGYAVVWEQRGLSLRVQALTEPKGTVTALALRLEAALAAHP